MKQNSNYNTINASTNKNFNSNQGTRTPINSREKNKVGGSKDA
jgi:hypothetical protein